MKEIKNYLLKFKFMNLSIYTKLLLSFLLIILFFCVISFIDFTYYKNDKLNNTLNTVNQMNEQSLSEIDSYIDDIEKLTEIPLFQQNPNIAKKLKESNSNPDLFYKLDPDLNFMFNTIFSLKNDIHSVFLFNLNGKSDYKISGSSLYNDYYPSNEQWFKDTIDSLGKPILVPSYKLEYMDDKPSGLNYFFTVSRALVDYDSSSVVGIITINSNINVIKNFLQKLLIYDNQQILLVDSYDNIIYDNDEDNISKPLSSLSLGSDINDNTKDKTLLINDKMCAVKITTSSNTGWKLINIIPNDSLNKQITNLRHNIIILVSFFIIIALILIIILSRQIVQPIQLLSKKMTLVEKGDLDISLNISTKDEVGKLSDNFNTMLAKLKELINEVYVDKLKQKETELKMLQNQINPHFLYNTLESIHMMAEINDDPEVSKMSISLGSILRYGLNTHISIVTLKDEINNVTLYMDLQKNRLDNIDDIYFDVPDNLLDAKVIKLILQPVVENSIYHGLSSILYGGFINVKAYIENDNLIIDIVDNGTGIDEITVTKLNGYINGFNDEFKSIGLKNVNMRIQIHYGIDYGITILGNNNNGTLVRIKLPLQY